MVMAMKIGGKKMDTQERIKQLKEWQEKNPLRRWRKSQNPKVGIIPCASMLGVVTSTIQTWESGTSNPTFQHMLDISKLIGEENIAEKWKKWLDQRPEGFY